MGELSTSPLGPPRPEPPPAAVPTESHSALQPLEIPDPPNPKPCSVLTKRGRQLKAKPMAQVSPVGGG